MKAQQEIFDKLGFNVDSKGFVYFCSTAEDVVNVMDTINECDDYGEFNNLSDYVKSIMLEDYHFYFEVGKKDYLDAVYDFLTSTKIWKNAKYDDDAKIFGVSNNDLKESDDINKKEDIVANFLISYSDFYIRNRNKNNAKQLKCK